MSNNEEWERLRDSRPTKLFWFDYQVSNSPPVITTGSSFNPGQEYVVDWDDANVIHCKSRIRRQDSMSLWYVIIMAPIKLRKCCDDYMLYVVELIDQYCAMYCDAQWIFCVFNERTTFSNSEGLSFSNIKSLLIPT